MSSPPEDPKASDAGAMEKEKEVDARKRKPTDEPCPDDSHEGEGGGDVAKEPELSPSPVVPPSSPLAASRARSRLSHSPPLAASRARSWLLHSPPMSFSRARSRLSHSPPLAASRARSRLPPSPLGSTPSSSPVAAHSARKLLRFYDIDTASIPSSADPHPKESLGDHGPVLALGVPEEAKQAFVDEEEDEIPYIGDKESLSSLADEYQSGTSIFQKKIKQLRVKYSGIRRVKGDGNCFYRSFMFAYLEYLFESQNDAEMVRVLATVERLREKLFELGKSPIVVSNYFDVFVKMVKRIMKGKLTHMELLQNCREEMSDDLVKFLRLVAACELCRRKDYYEPFVAGMFNTTVEEYCRRSVEPLGEETENMEIRALCDALGVSLSLANLDQSLINGVPLLNGLNFKPNNGTADNAQRAPLVNLLYRPGHYDILYSI